MQIKLFILLATRLVLDVQAGSSCGLPALPSGFVVNGTLSQKGKWPWIVSIHKAKNDGYLCGGTFLGANVVVTVSAKSSSQPRNRYNQSWKRLEKVYRSTLTKNNFSDSQTGGTLYPRQAEIEEADA